MNINLPANKRGRPAKLSSQSKRICTRMILSGEYRSATSVQRKLEMDNNVCASKSTINRAFNELNAVAKKNIQTETEP
ncbi:hypothetical protein AX774_g8244 [Zancudomyces culisetae]|uniref:Transposase Tc1-like domain-containing protein n=1 Tax=Zancudomyces culisetae TaxID=1213189 RepID=A0A1R1PBY8_ZANCU|nr:hypothetical protein AX774_g8244 [Zancudomyces culisetae]|eukprot:OMH78372.1 hypothetical protein AX774_g8244 [Zancudomyces culisetae]